MRAPGASATGFTQGHVAKVLYLSFLLMLNFGMPLTIVGIPEFVGNLLQQFLIFGGMVVRMYFFAYRGMKLDKWEKWIIAFVAYCYAVSFISNTFFLPQPLMGWLPGLIELMPLFLICTCKLFGYTERDVINALLLVAVIGASLTVIESFYPLPFLDYALRGSSQSLTAKRLVLFKNETALSLVICLARVLNAKLSADRYVYGFLLALFGYVLLVVQESRLAIAAALLACFLYLLFIYRGKSKPAILAIAAVVIALISMTVMAKYFFYASRVSNYATQDVSTRFRLIEGAYFYFYFLQTHGFGFGLMAMTPRSSNVLSFGLSAAGFVYARKAYPVSLGDVGVFAALFQFGYIGIASVLCMTYMVCRTLWKSAYIRVYQWRNEMGAIAAVAICFMLSPLPMNFFTLRWAMSTGAVLWFLSSRASIVIAKAKGEQLEHRHPNGFDTPDIAP